MKRMLAMLAIAIITVTAFGGIARAGGGHSDAASACQKGGWRSLHRSDGTAFENQGDCVSYTRPMPRILRSTVPERCRCFPGRAPDFSA